MKESQLVNTFEGPQAVAVIGAGKMGAAVVRVLAEAKAEVRVWNRSPERAKALMAERVTACTSPEEAVHEADVVISLLSNGAAVTDVMMGIGGALQRDAVLVEASTIDPSVMVSLAEAVGVERVVSAAVSGTPGVLMAGKASVLMSGPAEAQAKAREVLSLFAASTVDLGMPVANAKLVKIGINAVLAGTMELLGESVVLLEASGVDRDTFAQALAGSVLGSTYSGYKLSALAAHDYQPTFSTKDMRKDVALALDRAKATGVELPFAARLAELLDECVAAGWADLDFLSLVPRLQLAAGQPSDLSSL